MKSTENEGQLTLPIECPDCECGTILNCACDWSRVESKIQFEDFPLDTHSSEWDGEFIAPYFTKGFYQVGDKIIEIK